MCYADIILPSSTTFLRIYFLKIQICLNISFSMYNNILKCTGQRKKQYKSATTFFPSQLLFWHFKWNKKKSNFLNNNSCSPVLSFYDVIETKDKHCNFESDWSIYSGLKDFSLSIILEKKKKHFPIISNNLPNLDKNKMNFNLE